MHCIGLIPSHTDQDKRDKNATQAVNCQDNEGEYGVAKARETLPNQGNQGCKHSHDQRDFLRCLVVLTPFRTYVIGDGGSASQHLTVSR